MKEYKGYIFFELYKVEKTENLVQDKYLLNWFIEYL